MSPWYDFYRLSSSLAEGIIISLRVTSLSPPLSSSARDHIYLNAFSLDILAFALACRDSHEVLLPHCSSASHAGNSNDRLSSASHRAGGQISLYSVTPFSPASPLSSSSLSGRLHWQHLSLRTHPSSSSYSSEDWSSSPSPGIRHYRRGSTCHSPLVSVFIAHGSTSSFTFVGTLLFL